MPNKQSMKEVICEIAKMMNAPVHQFLCDHGKSFQLERLTTAETKTLKEVYVDAERKHCYRNSMLVRLNSLPADIREELIAGRKPSRKLVSAIQYCEGFTSPFKEGPMPIEHAWNTINDKLADVTPPERYHYHGYCFDHATTAKAFRRNIKRRRWFAILHDYDNRLPFLEEQGYLKRKSIK